MALRARFLMAGSVRAAERGPDALKAAIVLTAVKEWPGSGGAGGEVGVPAILDGRCARRLLEQAAGTWRNRGVTTASTGWPPRNAKGARPCPRATSMSALMCH